MAEVGWGGILLIVASLAGLMLSVGWALYRYLESQRWTRRRRPTTEWYLLSYALPAVVGVLSAGVLIYMVFIYKPADERELSASTDVKSDGDEDENDAFTTEDVETLDSLLRDELNENLAKGATDELWEVCNKLQTAEKLLEGAEGRYQEDGDTDEAIFEKTEALRTEIKTLKKECRAQYEDTIEKLMLVKDWDQTEMEDKLIVRAAKIRMINEGLIPEDQIKQAQTIEELETLQEVGEAYQDVNNLLTRTVKAPLLGITNMEEVQTKSKIKEILDNINNATNDYERQEFLNMLRKRVNRIKENLESVNMFLQNRLEIHKLTNVANLQDSKQYNLLKQELINYAFSKHDNSVKASDVGDRISEVLSEKHFNLHRYGNVSPPLLSQLSSSLSSIFSS